MVDIYQTGILLQKYRSNTAHNIRQIRRWVNIIQFERSFLMEANALTESQ